MLADRRILIDASMVTGGGGFTYAINILPLLATLAPEARFLVLARNSRLAQFIAPLPNMELRLLPQKGLPGRMLFLALGARMITRDWRPDLYFSVGEYAGLGCGCPVVVSFRNSNIFTRLDLGWGIYQRFRLSILRFLALQSARRASRVIFVSADSADWMGDAAGIPAEELAVIHHGIDVDAWRIRMAAGSNTASPGILSVSSIYRYKNFVRLIEAYCVLARKIGNPPALTIVGDDQDAQHLRAMRIAVEQAGEWADRIHLIGSVPHESVVSYYSRAEVFVFPSYLETFGHPLLEALASQLPVLASDMPVFREIMGDAAFYVDPFDVDSIADGMARVLEDRELARMLRRRGEERLEVFTWRASAEALIRVLDESLGGR